MGYTRRGPENSSTRDGMTRQTDGSRELKKNVGGTILSVFERIARGQHHVTLTDSSANDAAAYLNARKKDGIIKKGEKREYMYIYIYMYVCMYVRCPASLS